MKIWGCNDGGDWSLHSEITRADCKKQEVGDIWAVALSADEQYAACTTHDGKIHVWDLVEKKKLQTYETGSATGGHFGMCVDLSRDGRLTASGHMSGAVYVFNNDTGRMAYSLSSEYHLRLSHNACLCHPAALTDAHCRSCQTCPGSGVLSRQQSPGCCWRCRNNRPLRYDPWRARRKFKQWQSVISLDNVARLVRYRRISPFRIHGWEGEGVVDRQRSLRCYTQRDGQDIMVCPMATKDKCDQGRDVLHRGREPKYHFLQRGYRCLIKGSDTSNWAIQWGFTAILASGKRTILDT